jgi:hypothetical protein
MRVQPDEAVYLKLMVKVGVLLHVAKERGGRLDIS